MANCQSDWLYFVCLEIERFDAVSIYMPPLLIEMLSSHCHFRMEIIKWKQWNLNLTSHIHIARTKIHTTIKRLVLSSRVCEMLILIRCPSGRSCWH